MKNLKREERMANQPSKPWDTIHIFGFGEVQLIGNNVNGKAPISALTTAQAVIDNVYSLKSADSTATEEYHAINIFNEMFADWQTKDKNVEGWRLEYNTLDAVTIEALVSEIKAFVATEVVAPIAE